MKTTLRTIALGAIALSLAACQKDFLTEVDLASEAAMKRSLAVSTPDIGFYGEEGGGAALDSGRVWVADPLDGTINYALIGATVIWYVQVAVLIGGHACGLVLSHDRALALYGRAQSATTSQYWMLAVMVAFTTTGLFLLSQANQ